MKIEDLKEPYKSLAKKRREESRWKFDEELIIAFCWKVTPEGRDFWNDVDEGRYPPIPKTVSYHFVFYKECGLIVTGKTFEGLTFDSCYEKYRDEVGKEIIAVSKIEPFK